MYQCHPASEIFPLLSDPELQELADDIRLNGLREPICLWKDANGATWLLDGRNRIKACELADVRIETRVYTGDQPIEFIVSQNLHRRHLTPGQRAAIAASLEPLYAKEAAQHRGGRPRKGEKKPGAVLRAVSRSDERAAKRVGASGRAVSQYKRVAAAAPDLAEKVKAGSLPLDRAERVIRDREAQERRISQARKESKRSAMPARVDLRQGDFRVVLADVRNADAIITDPPYGAEFLPLLADLAKWADSALKSNGVIAVLIGQTHLPEVYRLLSGFRPYRWTCCLLTPGFGYVSHPRKIQSHWKPILIYGAGPRIDDVISAGNDRTSTQEYHRWGQGYEGFHSLVERLTKRGDLVIDPFMGSGTTLLAAHVLGRHAIGCDIDAKSVATAHERLK